MTGPPLESSLQFAHKTLEDDKRATDTSLSRSLKLAMKFATLATRALAATGLWSVGFASKSPLRGSRLGAAKEEATNGDRLVELANAITVLQDAGIDVADLEWGRKPQPEEQLIGSTISVGVAGIDVESLSGTELAFLEDALQFSFNQVNKGADVQVDMTRLFSQEPDGEVAAAASASAGGSSNLGRDSPTWRYYHGFGSMICRFCRPDRFLGASGVDSSSPLIVAWENKLEHVLQTSGFDAYAGVTDVDIHLGSGIVAAFAAAAEAAVAATA